jgi:hypothetical protein
MERPMKTARHHEQRGSLSLNLIVGLAGLLSMFLLVGCDETSGEASEADDELSSGWFDGNLACSAAANCPQYYSGCDEYAAACNVKDNQGTPLVGRCRCLDEFVFEVDCLCEACDPSIDAVVDTGKKLCSYAESPCDSDEECDEDGLECSEDDVCVPSTEGYLPCESDDECLFGWQCFDRPKKSMFSCYVDGENAELLDEPVWSWPDDMCCAPKVCVPKGWLNVPERFLCEGDEG